MALRPPIGMSDFRMVRESGAYYVDKTGFVADVLTDAAQALLFPRPRRFGKTLNLSTLRAFVEKTEEDPTPLFEGLAVWQSEEARRHFRRYPVIALTFKGVKEPTWPEAFAAIRRVIGEVFDAHAGLLAGGGLTAREERDFRAVLDGREEKALYTGALADLTRVLARHHGERVVLLVDEYDVPIQTGFQCGYYDEVTTFFRNFLLGGFKDNPHVFKGVLTGALRVAKESIFTGLNNVKVHSILGSRYLTAFGFTAPEVAALAGAVGRPELVGELARWYDGYRFGDEVIYNPWSIVNYAAEPGAGFRPYWVFTSSDDVLRGLVLESGHRVAGDFERLLRGETVEKEVNEHIVLRDVQTNAGALWSLLLMSGYLTARATRQDEGHLFATLAVPNVELAYVFKQSVLSWVQAGLGGEDRVDDLLRSMLAGDEARFARYLSELVLRTFSYHDAVGKEPERVYQAFLLGLLVRLEREYDVRSNRESGFGRYDVMVAPRVAGRPGVVLELKELEDPAVETVEQALDAALAQVVARRYDEELRARGADPVHRYGVVFDGKRVWVRRG